MNYISSTTNWWERSPNTSNSYNVYNVNTSGSVSNNNNAGNTNGVVPGSCTKPKQEVGT